MSLQFGVFDHIEPIPGQELDQIYHDRLSQVERFDEAGFYAYHLAEHHTPAVHSLAPSQNVFLAAASRTTQPVSYTHLRAHETDSYLVCRLLLEKKNKQTNK